ncbi:MAG: hypothetical protein IKN54_05445 [Lachnospiraceae bacterium]|nr:hypothetical protein [Lachnospiraceae bacterium]
MKIILFLQKIIVIIGVCFGLSLLFSEVPITESMWTQLKVTLGGLGLIALSILYYGLIGWEESRFSNETR